MTTEARLPRPGQESWDAATRYEVLKVKAGYVIMDHAQRGRVVTWTALATPNEAFAVLNDLRSGLYPAA